MNRYRTLTVADFQEVARCDNTDVGFSSWIAIHNSNRGPALGGCRVWHYDSEEDALVDVLRLSRAMTYKNSLARLPLGGGKCVVRTDLDKIDRTALFECIGSFVETLQGRYITAEDVNSTLADMAVVKRCTDHVATVGASGNPSPFTAYGVYCAIKAGVSFRFGKRSLKGMRVAIQGVGETGGRLAELLAADGCVIMAADINQANLERLGSRIRFQRVDPGDIYSVFCDVFAPCALGGTLDHNSIPKLRCALVAGSANNQLLEVENGETLHRRGITYIPDYAANAGGVINISCEIGQRYNPDAAWEKTARIGTTVSDILHQSKSLDLPTNIVADRLAEEFFALHAAA